MCYLLACKVLVRHLIFVVGSNNLNTLMEKISPSIFATILTLCFVALLLGLPSSELQTASWHVLCPSETRAGLACKQYISSVVKWEDNSLIPRLYSTPHNSLGMRPLLNIYSTGSPVERVLETCFMSQKQELGTKQERRGTGIGMKGQALAIYLQQDYVITYCARLPMPV